MRGVESSDSLEEFLSEFEVVDRDDAQPSVAAPAGRNLLAPLSPVARLFSPRGRRGDSAELPASLRSQSIGALHRPDTVTYFQNTQLREHPAPPALPDRHGSQGAGPSNPRNPRAASSSWLGRVHGAHELDSSVPVALEAVPQPLDAQPQRVTASLGLSRQHGISPLYYYRDQPFQHSSLPVGLGQASSFSGLSGPSTSHGIGASGSWDVAGATAPTAATAHSSLARSLEDLPGPSCMQQQQTPSTTARHPQQQQQPHVAAAAPALYPSLFRHHTEAGASSSGLPAHHTRVGDTATAALQQSMSHQTTVSQPHPQAASLSRSSTATREQASFPPAALGPSDHTPELPPSATQPRSTRTPSPQPQLVLQSVRGQSAAASKRAVPQVLPPLIPSFLLEDEAAARDGVRYGPATTQAPQQAEMPPMSPREMSLPPSKANVKFHISEGYNRTGFPESFESELLARLLEASSASGLQSRGPGAAFPDSVPERPTPRQFSMQKILFMTTGFAILALFVILFSGGRLHWQRALRPAASVSIPHSVLPLEAAADPTAVLLLASNASAKFGAVGQQAGAKLGAGQQQTGTAAQSGGVGSAVGGGGERDAGVEGNSRGRNELTHEDADAVRRYEALVLGENASLTEDSGSSRERTNPKHSPHGGVWGKARISGKPGLLLFRRLAETPPDEI